MALIAIPNVFAQRTTAKASEVNANFSEIASKFNASAVLTDVAKTITVTHTFSAGLTVSAGTTAVQALTAASVIAGTDPGGSELLRVGGSLRVDTITNDNVRTNLDLISTGAVGTVRFYTQNTLRATILAGGGLSVASGGITITGNSTITGTLGGITGLTVGGAGITVSAGGINISAGGLNVAGGIAGTLSTAAQPNITSVGILAAPHLTSPVVDSGGLTVSAGGATMTGTLAVTGRIVVSAHGMFGAWDGTGDAGSLGVSNNTTTTATAGAQSLPASPAGFLSWRLGAASIKVPYYNA